MAWTQTDLDAIEAAIATGELTVRFADREVTYRSIAELIAARNVIRDAVQGAAGTASNRFHFGQTNKG